MVLWYVFSMVQTQPNTLATKNIYMLDRIVLSLSPFCDRTVQFQNWADYPQIETRVYKMPVVTYNMGTQVLIPILRNFEFLMSMIQ